MPKRQTKQPNYRKADCVGNYGYGNGRAGKEFCSGCPEAQRCWTVTYHQAPYYADAEVVRRWQRLRNRLFVEGCSHVEMRASRRLLRKGIPDPALDCVAQNTRRGVEDRYRNAPEQYREFKGALWLYQGAIIGLYELAR